MKKIIFFVVSFMFFYKSASTQTTFDTCQYIQQFVGEWRYVNGSDTIRIYLRANRAYYTSYNSVEDQLYGWHEYKQGSTVVESIYQNRFMNLANVDTISTNSCSIGLKMGTGPECSPSGKASGAIVDYSQANETKIVTVTLDASGTLMTWKQRDREGHGFLTGATGMTLPREFILVKQ